MRPSSKRALRIAGIAVAGLAVAGALIWFSLNDADSQGPLINGKPVTYWTRHIPPVATDPNALRTLINEKSVAIPALVRQLSLPDSAAKDLAKRLWRRLPAALRARALEPTTPAELRAAAAYALNVISEQRTGLSLSEAQMMLPALTKALQDRDVTVRLFAINTLGNLGVISTQAIESCDVALRDAHWSVRANAVYALGRLANGDEGAIRRIKSALTDSHPKVREAAEQLQPLWIPALQDDASSATEAK